MTNDQVIKLLTDYKSYRYALVWVRKHDTGLPLYAASRLKGNRWDGTRYARIVEMIDGAMTDLLTDDQRYVIKRKYLDQDADNVQFNALADQLNRDRGTITRWHKEALRRLGKALDPLTAEDTEIHNLDNVQKTA